LHVIKRTFDILGDKDMIIYYFGTNKCEKIGLFFYLDAEKNGVKRRSVKIFVA